MKNKPVWHPSKKSLNLLAAIWMQADQEHTISLFLKHARQLHESQYEVYTSFPIHLLGNSLHTGNRNKLVSYQGVKEFASGWTMNVHPWCWQDALRAASFTPSANGATEYTEYFPALCPGAQFSSQHGQVRKFYCSVLDQKHHRCRKLLNTSSCFI